jgi:ribosomal protein S18 acetylase RimI-like enzyme
MENDDLVIKQGTINDLDTICELNKALFLEEYEAGRDKILDITWPDSGKGQDYYQKSLTNAAKIVLIALVKNNPIGYIIASSLGKYEYRKHICGEIENMYLVPSFRGKGYGKVLVDHAVIFLKSKGVKRVYVSAYSRNEKAIAFYDQCGFRLLDVGMEMAI